ncbi:MAG TPA: phytanoyl-CoA dioxygenase family protein [Acidimicrobiales bacterium]|nr:phytanoyl-CoA dioxygenase family protein [Acidimicrobiales bacterium]
MDSTGIRAITGDEVAHFRDHGWVRLDQLISPDLAAELLGRAKTIMGPDATEHVARPGIDSPTNPWQDRHNIVEDDRCFASVGLSAEMGANAQRLMRRTVGVLLYNNALAVKIGSQQGSSAPASDPTGFHQDGGGYPMDRCGVISFWIALDHLTAEMGTPRYVDRSHHLGPLGNMNRGGELQGSLFDVYPELREMTVTAPMELRPGDAAAHAMYTLHDAPANEGDRPRWAFLVRYLASDTIYTAAKTNSQATLRKITQAGLVAGEPFGGPQYPRVFG